jgi:Flp pilus assembly pilin Flp
MKSAAPMSLPRLPWQDALTRLADETGAVALEYGLIAALIAVAILGSIVQLSESLVGLPLQSIIDSFTGALS